MTKNYSGTSITKFIKPFVGLSLLATLGTFGYMFIEKWNWLDSLFMSVETLTTVGYGQVHQLTPNGKIFTIIYILFGVVLFLYFAAQFAEYIILVNFSEILSRKTMEKKLNKLQDHYIVCGYGRTGAEIISQLQNNKLPFVIVEKNPEFEKVALSENMLYIIGDATEDHILEKAGISRGRGLFCALSDDVDNLYLIVSATNINNDIKIVSRCIKASNEQKFKKAGANSIILPYEICARRMVSSVIKPLVVDFLDVVTHTTGEDLELNMEQFNLKKSSALTGQTIMSSELRQKTGVIIIAIKREGDFITNPSPHTKMQEGDSLITLGTISQLEKFGTLVS